MERWLQPAFLDTTMAPSDILTKEMILAALRRLDELLLEKGIIGEICAQYYSERLLAPKIRFFIEEIVEEIRP